MNNILVEFTLLAFDFEFMQFYSNSFYKEALSSALRDWSKTETSWLQDEIWLSGYGAYH